jgi:hypothetical protein
MIELLLATLALPMAQDTEQLRVRPTTEAAAVREFENSCMAGHFERASVVRAAGASPRKYSRTPDSSDGKVMTWLSNAGTLQFVGPETGTISRCTMTAFTASRVSQRELDDQLSMMVERKRGNERIREMEIDGRKSWSWQDSYGNPVRLVPIVTPKMPQQILFVLETVQRGQ